MWKYEDCSLQELEQLILQRGIAIKLRDTRNTDAFKMGFYVEVLKLVDRSPSFHPFLQLPPELRVSIYDYLLGDLDSAAANLGIMGVNKEIRHESTDVFWSRNTFELKVRDTSLAVQGKKMSTFSPLQPVNLFNPPWPDFLIKVRDLRIDFAVDTTRVGWPAYSSARILGMLVPDELTLYNHLLLSLSSFLSGRSDVQSVHLTLAWVRRGTRTQHNVVGDIEWLKACIRPLSMIAPLRAFTIEGVEPDILTQALTAIVDSTLAPGIIRSSWQHIYAAAQSCVRMRDVAEKVMTKASLPSPLWQYVVLTARAASTFGKILASSGTQASPSAWPFLGRPVESRLEKEVRAMKRGLSHFRYHPDSLELLDSQVSQASKEFLRDVKLKLENVRGAVEDLGELIGNDDTAQLTGHSSHLWALISYRRGRPREQMRWWSDVPPAFRKAKEELKVALTNPLLPKILMVRLPIANKTMAVQGATSNAIYPVISAANRARSSGPQALVHPTLSFIHRSF